MTTSATSIRMDNELKEAVNVRLEALGLNFNTFVVMAAKQLVAQNRLPFDAVIPTDNQRDRAIAELKQMLQESDQELAAHRAQAKSVQQAAEEVAAYRFD
ncbi:type II toxin-antitoxin system RelB/DinJ family antitoxin [Leuconostocaceae bacterium ESL0958]|nr:type II toxin-antitoxin system RelB/DinJ family antitoxin [Leuconostocaceae bacterium ESL0958]